MPANEPHPDSDMPPSLGGHVVPPERLAGIRTHMALLSATALAVNDRLPLEADVTDMLAVMDREEA